MTQQLQAYKTYYHHFKDLVQLERDEEISRHWDEIKNMPGKKREKLGRALLQMSGRNAGHGLGGTYLVKYVRQGGLPNNEISVGDLIIVSSGRPSGKEPQATVMEKTNFSLTVAFKNAPPNYAYKKALRIDLFANDITYQRMLEALKAVKNNTVLHDIVLAKALPHFRDHSTNIYFNQDLNSIQQQAVDAALQADPLFLIHGPPGTGKTTTLIEAIEQHAEAGHRMLATADSNTAVDNLVEKLAQQNRQVVRVGNPARINYDLAVYSLDHRLESNEKFKEAKRYWDQIDEYKYEQQDYKAPTGQNRRGLGDRKIKQLAGQGKTSRGIHPNKLNSMAQWLKLQDRINELAEKAIALEQEATHEILDHAEVVCTTNSSAGSDVMQDFRFDVVVVDEATQSVEPSCLIPMIKGQKFIMAGDHQQLPPTVLNQKAQQALQVSLFERLIDHYSSDINLMLKVQYRMNEEIMAFPNQAFYDHQLEAHQSVANHKMDHEQLAFNNDPLLSKEEAWMHQALEPDQITLFVDTGDFKESQVKGSFSYRNEKEAKMVTHLAQWLIHAGLPQGAVGIIAPYDGQVDLLKQWLHDYSGIEVKTVDGFQGREKEVIILSFVRSNEKGKLGFLTDYRRLNVAITRARKKLIMFGNAKMLGQNEVYRTMLQQTDVVEVNSEVGEKSNNRS